MRKRTVSLFTVSCALAIATSITGCSTPDARTLEDPLMAELDKRYETGTISKQEYERQRAEIHARRQREGLETGSPTNEAIRGMRR
jgi:hypothetical protein